MKTGRSSSPIAPRLADEDGSTGQPRGVRGPLREISGGVWLSAHPMAGAPDPLLFGEAQVAAQQLPVANLLAYNDLKPAILQQEWSVELGDSG